MSAPVYDPLGDEREPIDRSGVPRDRWGRAKLYTRNGEGPLPYTSASTLADTLQNDYGLNIWDRRKIAQGIGMDRELAARAGANQYNTGFGKPDKGKNREYGRELDEIVERGRDRAKAHERRDWGSAFHAYSEDRDPLGDPPEEMVDDLKSFWEAIDLAGYEIVDTEIFVANDELMAAGTGDHLIRDPLRPGKLIWLDKKTGVYHPETVPIQLCVYAGGEPYWVDDDDVHHRTTFLEKYGQEVDQEYGITAWTEAESGRTFFYPENLTYGREAAEHAIWVRGWHKQHRGKKASIDVEEIARQRAAQAIVEATYADPTLTELRAALQEIHKRFRAVWTPELTGQGKAALADVVHFVEAEG